MDHVAGRRLGIMLLGAFTLCAIFLGTVWRTPHGSESTAHAANKPSETGATGNAPVRVDVVTPHEGGMDRISVQPGSIYAYEATELYANVSGKLRKQYVDIGDRVTEGQLLLEIEAPEFLREVDRTEAGINRAVAEVGQMKARIQAAEANKFAAETGIAQAEAAVKRDQAALEFRDKQFKRFRELANEKSIDERLVDEKEDQRLAAHAAVDASNANLMEAKALVTSAEAKVEQAKSDLVDAEAHVEVAKADHAKAQVFADYTLIKAPYDGVISWRGFVRGDFIRDAEHGGSVPLLTVERTDVLRLVIYMPDSDVPFTDPGDDTVTEIESLPGLKFEGKISRIAFSEDKKTRTMRTEVDLKNDKGLLRNGMYGRTTLILQKGNSKAFTVPSSALVGNAKNGQGYVYVVRDGTVHKTQVTISTDNGVFVEVTDGISSSDQVVIGNNNSLSEGRKVEAHAVPFHPVKRH